MTRALDIARCALLLCVTAPAVSCESDFAAASSLSTVRILGIRSETPYVRPGASFTAEVLAYDGREDQSRPMRLYWLNDICISPADGKPEDCYRQFKAKYPRREDLTPMLTEGPRAVFDLPADVDADSSDPTLPTALVFVAACAGELRFVGSADGFPSSVPFGCFDEGRRLEVDDFVFAFMRLYISRDLENRNPTPRGVTLDGDPLPVDGPLSIPRCIERDIDDCPARKLAVTIRSDEQEIDPTSGPPGSARLKEQVWSSFFVSSGELESESLILFDARHGRTSGAENEYRAPSVAGEVDLFVVTHDNRSGVAFQSFRFEVE